MSVSFRSATSLTVEPVRHRPRTPHPARMTTHAAAPAVATTGAGSSIWDEPAPVRRTDPWAGHRSRLIVGRTESGRDVGREEHRSGRTDRGRVRCRRTPGADRLGRYGHLRRSDADHAGVVSR